jgi:hypothetical protein
MRSVTISGLLLTQLPCKNLQTIIYFVNKIDDATRKDNEMVKTSLRVTAFTLVGIICLFFAVRPSLADIEWTEKKQIKLEVTPIDMVTSPDGKWVIVLSSGEILVYSMPEGKVINRMPVDKAFDKLTYSAPDETIILSSSSGKTMKFVQMAEVHKFSLAGLPFKGPENAAVTIVVFSDYQ